MAVIFEQPTGQYKINGLNGLKPWEKDLIQNDKIIKESLKNSNVIIENKNKNEEKSSNNIIEQTNLDQKALWDREDALREHVEQREDTALQRWVEDARRAGINPNLALGATGAASGGGITSATPKDYTLQDTILKGEIDRVLQAIELEFKEDQNAKDRWNKLLSNFANIFALGQITNSKQKK